MTYHDGDKSNGLEVNLKRHNAVCYQTHGDDTKKKSRKI